MSYVICRVPFFFRITQLGHITSWFYFSLTVSKLNHILVVLEADYSKLRCKSGKVDPRVACDMCHHPPYFYGAVHRLNFGESLEIEAESKYYYMSCAIILIKL